MLKRQRPISPPPLTPTIPFIESDIYNIVSKRRRTVPPPLDGQSRGWAEESDHDEHWSDGDSTSQEVSAAYAPEQLDTPGEYKVANTMLHELHTLQQHRLFSPPLLLPTSSTSSLSRSPQTSCSPSVLSNDHSRVVPIRKDLFSLPTDYSDMSSKDPMYPTKNALRPIEETLCVKERYEDTNRLLGSLFLSRRRQLDSHGGSNVAT